MTPSIVPEPRQIHAADLEVLTALREAGVIRLAQTITEYDGTISNDNNENATDETKVDEEAKQVDDEEEKRQEIDEEDPVTIYTHRDPNGDGIIEPVPVDSCE